MTSLVVQMVRHLPTMWETQVQSLGWEDPLEKEMGTHSSTLAWESPWTEKPGRLQSMGSQRVDTTEHTHIHARTQLVLKSYLPLYPNFNGSLKPIFYLINSFMVMLLRVGT